MPQDFCIKSRLFRRLPLFPRLWITVQRIIRFTLSASPYISSCSGTRSASRLPFHILLCFLHLTTMMGKLFTDFNSVSICGHRNQEFIANINYSLWSQNVLFA